MRSSTSQKQRPTILKSSKFKQSVDHQLGVGIEAAETFEPILTPKQNDPSVIKFQKASELHTTEVKNFKQVFAPPKLIQAKVAQKNGYKRFYVQKKISSISSNVKLWPSQIRGSWINGIMSSNEPTIATGTVRSRDSEFSKSGVDFVNAPGSVALYIKTDAQEIDQIQQIAAEGHNFSLEASPIHANEDKLTKNSSSNQRSINAFYFPSVRSRGSQSTSAGRDPNRIHLKALVQEKCKQILENRLNNSSKAKLYENSESEKEIHELLEGSVINTTKRDSSFKIQVSRRNRDTALHFSKIRPPTSLNSPKSFVYQPPSSALPQTTKTEKQLISIFPDTCQITSSWRRSHTKDTAASGSEDDSKRLRKQIINSSSLKKLDFDISKTNSLLHHSSQKHFDLQPFTISRNVSIAKEGHRDDDNTSVLKDLKSNNDSPNALIKVINIDQESDTTDRNPDDNSHKEIEINYDDMLASLLYPEELKRIDQKSIMHGASVYNKKLLSCLPVESKQMRQEVDKIMKTINQKLDNHNFNPEKVEEVPMYRRPILDECDIITIQEEYNKIQEANGAINYDKIDSIVINLKFFSNLTKEIRMSLLKCAFYAHYPSGATIFRQGDYGDLMYIILRGSVHVRATIQAHFGPVKDVIVAVIYDGFHFGDYALMGTSQKNKNKTIVDKSIDIESGETKDPVRSKSPEIVEIDEQSSIKSKNDVRTETSLQGTGDFKERTKRTATVIASESCDLLCIPRRSFQEILLNLFQKELDAKIQLLLCLPFFSKMDPYTLIPIANNLFSKIYQVGDVILNAGDPVEKFMIVASGRCKVALEVINHVNSKPSIGLRRTVIPLREFDTGLQDYTCPETSNRDEIEQKKNSTSDGRYQASSEYTGKSFDQEIISIKNHQVYYKEHVIFNNLTRGDFFGGRSLFSKEDFDKYDDRLGKLGILSMPARLSVIADSSVVEIFELDKEHLTYIPKFLTNILLNGLKNEKEYDDYDMEKEKNNVTEWVEFRNNQINNIVLKKHTEDQAYYKKF